MLLKSGSVTEIEIATYEHFCFKLKSKREEYFKIYIGGALWECRKPEMRVVGRLDCQTLGTSFVEAYHHFTRHLTLKHRGKPFDELVTTGLEVK